uniref:Secreted protein n=1 Tax=Panagrellus redivivus TaxID=6233 RepID=A0A7E4UT72_PANRE
MSSVASSRFTTLIVATLIAAIALLAVVVPYSEAAPTSDAANAYRILSNYMKQFDDRELDSAGYIVFDDKSSIKRALGPRPLRFG